MVTSTARAVGGEPSGLQEKGPASPAAKAGGEQSSSAPAPKPATAKVEQGPFKVEVSLTGVFESAKMAEVSVKPRAWSQPLVVEKAIELGSPVKQGDILVEFDREKIDKAIQDAEVENLLGELALKQAEEELPVLEKLLPIDLAAAERARNPGRRGPETVPRDRPAQLREDGPVRRQVGRRVSRVCQGRAPPAREDVPVQGPDRGDRGDHPPPYAVPGRVGRGPAQGGGAPARCHAQGRAAAQEIKAREAAVRQALELQKARASLPLTLSQKRLALAKLQHDHARADEKLADLRKDREAMTVHAPADGLVYYGRSEHGNWPNAAATGSKLRKGGVIAADEVFITVVAPRPLAVRATVDEKDLHQLSGRAELKGRVDARRRSRARPAGPARRPRAGPPRVGQVRRDRRRRARTRRPP